MSVCPTTWLNMAVVDLTCDVANTVHGRNGIEMDARHAVTDQLAALFHRPLYPYLFGFFVRFTFSYFQSQSLGQVAMERFRYYVELRQFGKRLDTRDDGDGDAGPACTVHEVEILRIVVEQLGDGVCGTHVGFLLEHGQVGFRIGCFLMFFWVAGYAV